MTADPPRGVCPKHESLEVSLVRIEHATREGFAEMSDTLKAVHRDLREGAVTMGQLSIRVGVLERVTYGCVGLALAGLATAILALVLKGGG